MPVKYKIFESRKLVYAVGVGEVTYDDLMRHFDELAADSKYISPMKKLVDYRKSTLSSLSLEESKKITKKKVQLVEKFKNEKCAFVATSELDFGMTRFHETHIDGSSITTNVFHTIEDALSWLEVDITVDEGITE